MTAPATVAAPRAAMALAVGGRVIAVIEAATDKDIAAIADGARADVEPLARYAADRTPADREHRSLTSSRALKAVISGARQPEVRAS